MATARKMSAGESPLINGVITSFGTTPNSISRRLDTVSIFTVARKLSTRKKGSNSTILQTVITVLKTRNLRSRRSPFWRIAIMLPRLRIAAATVRKMMGPAAAFSSR